MELFRYSDSCSYYVYIDVDIVGAAVTIPLIFCMNYVVAFLLHTVCSKCYERLFVHDNCEEVLCFPCKLVAIDMTILLVTWGHQCWSALSFVCLIQVRLRTEALSTSSLTQPGFKLMTSRSWQDISCHWDACSNHSAISDTEACQCIHHRQLLPCHNVSLWKLHPSHQLICRWLLHSTLSVAEENHQQVRRDLSLELLYFRLVKKILCLGGYDTADMVRAHNEEHQPSRVLQVGILPGIREYLKQWSWINSLVPSDLDSPSCCKWFYFSSLFVWVRKQLVLPFVLLYLCLH